jgi:hypothetical protein
MDLDGRVADFLSDSWDLPGNPMVCQALVLGTFLDAEGQRRWAFFPMGDWDTPHLLGLLEITKQSLVDEAIYGDDEDEDD